LDLDHLVHIRGLEKLPGYVGALPAVCAIPIAPALWGKGVGASLVVLVDAADFEPMAQFEWYAARTSSTTYAGCSTVRRSAIAGGSQYMHRLLLGVPPGLQVDHINGDGLDNRRANLRIATPAQNMQNRRPRRGAASSFKGVIRYPSARTPWGSYISRAGKKAFLGAFPSEEAAARAYDAAARELFGEFAWLNFPGDRA
jgi:hypothetical protein